MKSKTRKIIIIGAVLLIFSTYIFKSKQNIITTASNLDKTISWGIKRASNNKQTDVGDDNWKLLEENGGICLGKDTEKNIYLTFDEGYEAGYTFKILDVLNENNVKATFFITAHYLNTAPDLVERMIKEGHIVGNQFPTMVMYHIFNV